MVVPRRTHRHARRVHWLAATTCFVVLSIACIRQHRVPLSSKLTLDVVLSSGPTGSSEPLITVGETGSADFLYVRRVAPNKIVFGTDSWGFAGTESSPINFATDKTHRLVIVSPALSAPQGGPVQFTGSLRVVVDGTQAFDTRCHFFRHAANQVYFGLNPVGGSIGARLSGKICDVQGDQVQYADDIRTDLSRRLFSWVIDRPLQPIAVLVLSILFARLVHVCAFLPMDTAADTIARVREHRAFVLTALFSGAAVWLDVTYGTGQLVYPEPFAVLFDYQARSLLHGHLDVPLQALAGEAFIYGGKYYGYFGPTPAILRMPFVIFDLAFGNVSRLLMLAYFVGSIGASYLILREVFRIARGPNAGSTTSTTIFFLLNAGVGSTLFYLCGRSFMYHEAIMCGVVFALFSGWCALRYFTAPRSHWWIGAVICGLASIQARPPTGLFAFTFLGAVVGAILIRDRRRNRADESNAPMPIRKALLLLGLCGLGVLSFNGMSYLKFKTFEGAPLRYSQPYGPERLAHIDGKSFHRANIPWGFYCYVLHPNCRFEPRFPYLFIGSDRPGWDFPNAKIDLPDYMLACPYAMPGLFALATIGCALAFWRAPQSRLLIAAAWLAVLPMALALFAAIAIAQRYTGDFCPFLIIAAAFGTVGIERCSPTWRGCERIVLGLITIAAVLITFALTFDYQGRWGPNMQREVQQRYEAVAQRVDRTVDAWIAR
jgi:hypothetical protein